MIIFHVTHQTICIKNVEYNTAFSTALAKDFGNEHFASIFSAYEIFTVT